MWQVMLAAAVAGSGFFAKRFLNTTTTTTNSDDPNIEVDTKCDQSKELQQKQQQQQHLTTPPSKPQLAIPLAFQSCNDCKSESETQSSTAVGDGSIFMFSSPVSKGETGSRFGSKKSGGNREGFKTSGFEKVERKCGGFDQSKSGKKFAVCLKKRRTSKNSPGKCESCSSKDNSTFSWGLGVGIMCMMSAGKAEISRLNTAVDETTKVVQELKTEFSRRKSARNLQVSSSKTEISTSPYKTRGKHTEPIPQSSTENRDNVQDSGVFVTEEGECASSVLTEEPQQEVLEMDRLEAELESELQKLPWCSTGASGFEGKISDICENEHASFEGFYKPDGQTSDSCQLSGVLPSELDQKLCHLLIEQQESQIVGLESELHWAQSKLHEKEAELQALKDCVKSLTEFSLATASDEESEAQKEEEKIIDHGDYDNKMGQSSSFSDVQSQGVGSSIGPIYSYSSVHGGVEGESAQRCKARLERHRRTAERAAKALAEKNMRDLLAEREQAERNRLAEALDAEVKRWSSGKEANLRALLSTLQYILGPDSGWQPIPLTEVITSVAVKKAYRKATLCVHPDKLQQRGASVQQKYICEKVFDLLKEAWNGFNSEEQ